MKGGVGAKKVRHVLRNPGKPNFERDNPDFSGISRRCPKSLRKQSLCSILAPINIAKPLESESMRIYIYIYR